MTEQLTTQARLTEQWQALRGWPHQMRFLIKLGNELPACNEQELSDRNRVEGCESEVWLCFSEDSDGVRHWRAHSEPKIIRGLIALVFSALDHKTQSQAQAVDLEAWFAELGLLRHLSPSRGNGLRAIADRMQSPR